MALKDSYNFGIDFSDVVSVASPTFGSSSVLWVAKNDLEINSIYLHAQIVPASLIREYLDCSVLLDTNQQSGNLPQGLQNPAPAGAFYNTSSYDIAMPKERNFVHFPASGLFVSINSNLTIDLNAYRAAGFAVGDTVLWSLRIWYSNFLQREVDLDQLKNWEV